VCVCLGYIHAGCCSVFELHHVERERERIIWLLLLFKTTKIQSHVETFLASEASPYVLVSVRFRHSS
jgi:hypothetical protein